MRISSYVIGPKLPQKCEYGSMLPLPDGESAILVGCHYYDNSYSSVYSDQIFQLSWNDEDNLEWSTMSQKLKFKRRASVVMMIPDELTTCTW